MSGRQRTARPRRGDRRARAQEAKRRTPEGRTARGVSGGRGRQGEHPVKGANAAGAQGRAAGGVRQSRLSWCTRQSSGGHKGQGSKGKPERASGNTGPQQGRGPGERGGQVLRGSARPGGWRTVPRREPHVQPLSQAQAGGANGPGEGGDPRATEMNGLLPCHS